MQERAHRIDGLDFARGIAVLLMLISHGVKGLLYHREMPEWGLVPVHLVTKFSSTLFILVFGVSVALFYLPRVRDDWLRWRDRLWWRALVLLFWYKVLTVVQLAERVPAKVIKSVLLFRLFPDFVEILSFYAFTLMWLAPTLAAWSRLPIWAKAALVPLPAALGQWLHSAWGFFGLWPLRAILVEDSRLFCYGVLTRGSFVLLGLMIGEALLAARRWGRLVVTLAAAGGALLLAFFISNSSILDLAMRRLARNVGKHPPSIEFVLFSLGGALALLALALAVRRASPVLRPLTAIGREALVVFVVHISIIFGLYRYAWQLRGEVTYLQALGLTGALVVSSWAAAEGWRYLRRRDVGRSVGRVLGSVGRPLTRYARERRTG